MKLIPIYNDSEQKIWEDRRTKYNLIHITVLIQLICSNLKNLTLFWHTRLNTVDEFTVSVFISELYEKKKHLTYVLRVYPICYTSHKR